jgi:hypothetical protein
LTNNQISEINRVSTGDTYTEKTDFSCSWGECELGAPTAKTKILLIGDSHALMYHPTFSAIGRRGESLFVKSFTTRECPNVLDATKVSLRSDLPKVFVDSCINLHPATLSYLRTFGHKFDYIVLSDNSPIDTRYVTGAAEYLTSLKGFGSQVVVLGQAPVSKDLSSCLNRDYSNYFECSGKKPSSMQDYQASQKAGVAFGDLGSLFCIGNFCPLLIGDAPTTARGHLTDVSASGIAPYFLDFLKGAKVPAK